jgi:hypothetical protein
MSTNPNSLATVMPGAQTSFCIHSSDLYQADLQHASITLTAAQIIGMYVTPVLVVATPPSLNGVAVAIVPERWMFRMSSTATAFTAGGAVSIQFGSTGSGGGTALGDTLAASVITATNTISQTLVQLGASNITLTAASGIYVTNATQSFATGTGTATLDLWYAIA